MSGAQEAWLSAPWAGALLRFVADPAMGLNPEAAPLGLGRALAYLQREGVSAVCFFPRRRLPRASPRAATAPLPAWH